MPHLILLWCLSHFQFFYAYELHSLWTFASSPQKTNWFPKTTYNWEWNFWVVCRVCVTLLGTYFPWCTVVLIRLFIWTTEHRKLAFFSILLRMFHSYHSRNLGKDLVHTSNGYLRHWNLILKTKWMGKSSTSLLTLILL